MSDLPVNQTLLIRTDFSDDARWAAARSLLQRHSEGSGTQLHFVDDHAFDGQSPEQVGAFFGTNPERTFTFVADLVTLGLEEHPVLVVDLADVPGRAFRVIPPEVANVQTNLELGDAGFDDYVERCDEDGVFRG